MKKTLDYDKFCLLELNRDLNRNHINKLKKSIEENGYLTGNPIIVNEKMEILDGQHRFIALKELGMEIPYGICNVDYAMMIRLNTTQRSWSANDYINYYSEKDHNPNYIRLRKLMDAFKLNATTILIMRDGFMSGTQSETIRNGAFKLNIDDELRIREFIKNFEQVIKPTKLKFSQRLCSGMTNIANRKGFKWNTLISKAKKYPTLAHNCRTSVEFEKMLQDLYNYNIKKNELKI